MRGFSVTRFPHELLVLGLPTGDQERTARRLVQWAARLTDVRVRDALLVVISDAGVTDTVEITGTDPGHGPAGGPPGLISAEDVTEIGSVLSPGTGAVAVLVEHVWATRLSEDVDASDLWWVAALPVPTEWVRAAGQEVAARRATTVRGGRTVLPSVPHRAAS